jgi:DNA-directed RNA polymerase specialized sigma24 family protein
VPLRVSLQVRESHIARGQELFLILRQLDGMSYNEIAMAGTPVGAVMSSLSRRRERLGQALAGLMKGTAVAKAIDGNR